MRRLKKRVNEIYARIKHGDRCPTTIKADSPGLWRANQRRTAWQLWGSGDILLYGAEISRFKGLAKASASDAENKQRDNLEAFNDSYLIKWYPLEKLILSLGYTKMLIGDVGL